MREPRAHSAHGEAGPDYQWITKISCGGQHVLDRMTDAAARYLGRATRDAAQTLDDRLELLPILAALDRLDGGADELDSVALQDAALMERNGGVQRCLAAESGQQRIRPLLRD